LQAQEIQWLIEQYHAPYHGTLSGFVGKAKLAVDCHTMAEFGPPVGPDHGVRRPLVCLGDGAGTACPGEWVDAMRDCMVRYFGPDVTINKPFSGGYTTRFHGAQMPWLQIELSRTADVSIADKHRNVFEALRDWCALSLPAAK